MLFLKTPRVSELLTGGVDIAINVPPTDWERVDKNDGTHMVSETSNRNIMLTVRATEGYPTADKRFVKRSTMRSMTKH